jgi:hypothetical protein
MGFVSSNNLDKVQALKSLKPDFGHVIMHIMALLSSYKGKFCIKRKALIGRL